MSVGLHSDDYLFHEQHRRFRALDSLWLVRPFFSADSMPRRGRPGDLVSVSPTVSRVRDHSRPAKRVSCPAEKIIGRTDTGHRQDKLDDVAGAIGVRVRYPSSARRSFRYSAKGVAWMTDNTARRLQEGCQGSEKSMADPEGNGIDRHEIF
jgi:hypothetical protein